jgi:ABC-type multidrug transport system ATPase subunit
MGGSGAGKTTLADCVLGRKTVGLVRLAGGLFWLHGPPRGPTDS